MSVQKTMGKAVSVWQKLGRWFRDMAAASDYDPIENIEMRLSRLEKAVAKLRSEPTRDADDPTKEMSA